MEEKAQGKGAGVVSTPRRDIEELRRTSDPSFCPRRWKVMRRANRPPSKDELKELLVAAFAAGVVITAAYFMLFIVK